MGCKLPAHPLRAPYSLLVAVHTLDVNLMLDQRLEHAWRVQGARKEDARRTQGVRRGCARGVQGVHSAFSLVFSAVPFNMFWGWGYIMMSKILENSPHPHLKNIFLSVRDATTPN